MNKKRLLTLALFAVLAAGGFAQKDYQRIVSLAPSLTESLYYLEAQQKLIGCTSYCVSAKADKKEIVASAIKPNIEKIIKLKPDLVVGSSFTDPKDIATLKKFGIRVEIYHSPKSFDEICSQFISLGELVGKQRLAADIVKQSRNTLDKISKSFRWKSTPKIFFQIGADPIFTVLDNTFMADYITLLGGKNIASGLQQGSIGREFVITQNPDYIFITTMGVVGEDEKTTWGKYSTISAIKNSRIYVISEIACLPTPVTFVKTMEDISKLINNK